MTLPAKEGTLLRSPCDSLKDACGGDSSSFLPVPSCDIEGGPCPPCLGFPCSLWLQLRPVCVRALGPAAGQHALLSLDSCHATVPSPSPGLVRVAQADFHCTITDYFTFGWTLVQQKSFLCSPAPRPLGHSGASTVCEQPVPMAERAWPLLRPGFSGHVPGHRGIVSECCTWQQGGPRLEVKVSQVNNFTNENVFTVLRTACPLLFPVSHY